MGVDGAYPVPAARFDAPHESSTEVRKSRFLAQGFRADNPAAARAAIEARKARYPDATHNCWAYLAGPPGDTARVGSSDDGEPHGTAGRPILNVLLHSGLGEIVMVVTRWFGGTKLGTGGLVRAYQESALANLATMPTEFYAPSCTARLRLDYTFLEQAKRIFPAHGAVIVKENYSDKVELILELPSEAASALSDGLAAISNGKAFFELF